MKKLRIILSVQSVAGDSRQKYALPPVLLVMLFACVPGLAQFQQPRSPQLPVPPPMRFISRHERAKLDSNKDARTRTRTSIDLATARLSQAEQFTLSKRFESASQELGCYLALIDDTMYFLGGLNADKSKTRDLYRYIDLALRAHLPRLIVMRRATPAEYAVNIKVAEEHARNARSDALDSFYGTTVIRERSEKKPEKTGKDNNTPAPDSKRP